VPAHVPATRADIDPRTDGLGLDPVGCYRFSMADDPPPPAPREPTAEMIEALYQDLRELAHARMRRERPDSTLRTTELVHEAYLRLGTPGHRGWANRAHFFASAAEAMRRILIEHARARAREKRGGQTGRPPVRVSLSDLGPADLGVDYDPDELLTLDRAIERLRSFDSRAAEVVLLRFYAGLSVEEVAEALGVADRTIKRDWTVARAWLHRELSSESAADGPAPG
jgi:RNA polymerase sigma factor (TIGR02999 family)